MRVSANTIGEREDRRKRHGDRRRSERRVSTERRYDRRENGRKHNRSFYGWFRSVVKLRLGVDRRKSTNRRIRAINRRQPPSSLLTKGELTDLLK